MISRKLIAALVGLTLVGGTVANASATVTSGKIATKSVTTTTTVPHVRKIAVRHNRLHVTHRVIKRMKVTKLNGSKRLALSHVTKRVASKHV